MASNGIVDVKAVLVGKGWGGLKSKQYDQAQADKHQPERGLKRDHDDEEMEGKLRSGSSVRIGSNVEEVQRSVKGVERS